MTTSLRRRARRISGNRIAPRDRPGPNHHRPRLGLRYRHRPIIEAAKAYRTKSGIRVRIFPTVPDPTPASNPTPAFDIDGPATLHNLGIAPPQAIGAPDTNAVAWTFTLGGDVHQALALHNDPGVASAPLWHFADRQPWTVGKLYAMLQVSQITCHASVEG